MVFPCLKRGRYFGFRLAGATHEEKPSQSIRSLHTVSRRHNQRPGGWWYHPSAVIPHRDR